MQGFMGMPYNVCTVMNNKALRRELEADARA